MIMFDGGAGAFTLFIIMLGLLAGLVIYWVIKWLVSLWTGA